MDQARQPDRPRPLFLCIAAALLFCIFHPALAADDAEPVYAGDAFRLQSKSLNESRRYLVRLPKDYAFVKDDYPVVVLLDGDEYFQLVSSTVDLLASTGRIPEMIVVGVPNTNRFRDLSPQRASSDGAVREDWPKKFLAFLSDELIPEIDRTYRTKPQRILVGHSVGGLFVVYSLLNEAKTFRGYVAISPAFGDNRALVDDVEPFLLANKNLQADFYMTMANERGQQLGGAWELASILQERAPREVRWQFQRHPEETHFSVIHRSVYDGLQFMYQGWYLADPFALYEQAGLGAIEKHYAQLSARVGYDVPIAESSLTSIVYALTFRNRQAEGEAIVKRALEMYPHSADLHFALGRFFHGMKDEQRAISHLTKTLELYPDNGTARRMLTSLGVDADKIAPPVEISAATLASYHGSYRAGATTVQVSEENGRLYAINALSRHQLKPLSATRFYCVDGDKQFTFSKGGNGRVAKLVVHQNGNDFELARQK